jgi:hypothetical protein
MVVHNELPAAEACPLGQALQVLAPLEEWVLTGQVKQEELPAAEYWPLGQVVQAEAPLAEY